MSSIEVNAAAVTAPGDVYVRPTSAAAEILTLETVHWEDQWISVQAETTDVFIRFGTTTATATPHPTNVSALAAPIAPAADGSWLVPAGTTKEFLLRNFVTLTGEELMMGHITGGAAGVIRFYRSSGSRAL